MDKLLLDLKARMLDHSRKMDDPKGDGTGADARCPDGDDWNRLYNDVLFTLAELAKCEEESYTEQWLEVESSVKGVDDWNRTGTVTYGTIFQAQQAMNKSANLYNFDWRILEVTNTRRPIYAKGANT